MCAPSRPEASSFVGWVLGRVVLSFFSPNTSRSVFARKLGTGIRTGLAFAISGSLASRPWASQLLGNPSWYVVFSVLFIKDTVGGTIDLIDSLYRCLTLSTLVDTAILATGIGSLGTVPLVVTVEAVLFATTVLYCYLFHDLNQKRYILSIHAVVLVQLANRDAALFFPAQLLCCMALAAIGAVALICLPFPRLASNELLERWRLAVSSTSEAMGEALGALESSSAVEVRVRLTEARFLLARVLQSLPTLWRLQTETSREAAVFRILFPLSPGFRDATAVDVGRCEEMHWIALNTCHLVEQLHITSDTPWTSPHCQHILAAFHQAQSDWLSLISSEDMETMNEAAVVSGRIRVGAVFHALSQAIQQTDSMEREQPGRAPAAIMRKALVFQLSRWVDAIVSLEVDPAVARAMTESHSTAHTAFFAWKRLVTAQPHNPMRWSFFGLHPLQDLWSTLTNSIDAVRHPSVDYVRLKASLKTAVILCTTAIIAVVPPLQQNWIFPEAVWAVYSYVNVISSNEGMLWANSLHRLVGTFCGGIAGYLVLFAFGDGWIGTIAVLSVWNLGLVWLDSSLSNPASFSATIIVFGRHLSNKANQLSPEDYALTRMIEIGIGVVIAAVMSALLFPVSSLHLIREEWKGCITACDEVLSELRSVYQQLVQAEQSWAQQQEAEVQGGGKTGDASAAHVIDSVTADSLDDAHLEQLLQHSANLGHSLSRQQQLLINIATEPVVLMVPPPTAVYLAIIDSIRALWQLSLNVEAAARQLLLRRGLHGTASEVGEPAPHTELCWPLIEAAWELNHQLLHECVDVIDKQPAAWGDAALFARVRGLTEQLERRLENATSPALGALLHNVLQVIAETSCLRRKVQSLLQAERPNSFDD